MKFEDKNIFSIDPKHISRIRLAIGLLFLSQALFNLFFANPETLSTGRWSWIYLTVTAAFGTYGYPIFQAFVGLAFIAYSRKQSETIVR